MTFSLLCSLRAKALCSQLKAERGRRAARTCPRSRDRRTRTHTHARKMTAQSDPRAHPLAHVHTSTNKVERAGRCLFFFFCKHLLNVNCSSSNGVKGTQCGSPATKRVRNFKPHQVFNTMYILLLRKRKNNSANLTRTETKINE